MLLLLDFLRLVADAVPTSMVALSRSDVLLPIDLRVRRVAGRVTSPCDDDMVATCYLSAPEAIAGDGQSGMECGRWQTSVASV